MRVRVEVIRGDITKSRVDAIVNAANPSLLGGGGVDGAIHRAAGPQLLAACRQLGSCPRGEARVTNGFNLPAHFIIHTPGPIWQGGIADEAHVLADCYRNSLQLAEKMGCRTVDFASISTGIYGFPLPRAARIATQTINEVISENPGKLRRIRMVAFDGETENAYKQALSAAYFNMA
ncbi:O-acetyl-ADP-ribose deacetylase [Lacticaseibacillus pabuli]|uniref:O-acetyl-ADP-ribose deacetylase n=1 Tax=Lacticaseibacillus pabuli TaxID=3025672 RepID=A0ABY7WRV6_9LACO|nr:O-acetyl-ADP-ribose deacetylase [Lacticaseibacillus sp. KACC 23028]WDF82919.1 O-acetyl-ADP-ribose deacetylase [Lacticaseibacillus sp. KACC 23028]